MRDTGFSHSVEKDHGTGWRIVRLGYHAPGDLRNDLEVCIAPEAGANLYSMRFGQTQLLVEPQSLSELPGFDYGFPILYPTPNRVQDSHFVFDGRPFRFTPNDGPHFLHGLVHSLRWEMGTPTSDSNGAHAAAFLDWDQSQAGFPCFPIIHRLHLDYHLTSRGVRFEFTVENRDERHLPFGFGLHPWFRILGTRAKTWLQVPAPKHMEAVDLIPTGRLMDLEGSPLDLRTPVSLQALDLDDVYWGMTPNRSAGYEARDRKIKVSLTGSAEFTHMVVYTPAGKPYFCMENQTCSTDAHNLSNRGFEREAHLLIAEKGKPVTGWVQVELSRLD